MEGCKLRFAETDKPEWGLVTRDYALVFFFCIPKTSKRAKKTKTDIFGNFGFLESFRDELFSGFRKNLCDVISVTIMKKSPDRMVGALAVSTLGRGR